LTPFLQLGLAVVPFGLTWPVMKIDDRLPVW